MRSKVCRNLLQTNEIKVLEQIQGDNSAPIASLSSVVPTLN